jgi:isopentenyl-diphosphate delta-isomerase
MTGGHSRGKRFNTLLAAAAQEFGIAFGVGSQRAAIENPRLIPTYRVRRVAPDIFLIGNLGLPQLLGDNAPEVARFAVEMIDADALSIHLNPLQEAVQPEGQPIYRGGLQAIKRVCKHLEVPVIVKETGSGITGGVAKKLMEAGAAAIDVSGAGGTSWAGVELQRVGRGIGATLWDWGVPTSVATLEVASSVRVPVIASGGVRSGLDAAKALALGADLVGLALPVLKAAARGEKALRKFLENFLTELKVTMFLSGCRRVKELREAELVVTGRTREWLISRGFDLQRLGRRRG